MNILRLTLIQIMKDYQSYILRNEELLLLEESTRNTAGKRQKGILSYIVTRDRLTSL